MFLSIYRFNVSGPIDLNLTNLTQSYVPFADSRGVLVFTQPMPIATIELFKNQLH
jgi:hypothetical protein